MLSMVHFHLIFKYSFLTFKYSTVFISLLDKKKCNKIKYKTFYFKITKNKIQYILI